MNKSQKNTASKYTCNEYREEMMLLGLRRQLQNSGLTADERKKLLDEIERLERLVGF